MINLTICFCLGTSVKPGWWESEASCMLLHWYLFCSFFICIPTFRVHQSGEAEVHEAAKSVAVYTEGGAWLDFELASHS